MIKNNDRSSGNSNPFISICNRNAEPSAQTPKYLSYNSYIY
jgi:hypothetical protein